MFCIRYQRAPSTSGSILWVVSVWYSLQLCRSRAAWCISYPLSQNSRFFRYAPRPRQQARAPPAARYPTPSCDACLAPAKGAVWRHCIYTRHSHRPRTVSPCGRNDGKKQASRPLGGLHMRTPPCLSCDAYCTIAVDTPAQRTYTGAHPARCTAHARRHGGVCVGPSYAATLCHPQHAVMRRR
jgi:hypothetical protein